MKSFLCRVMTFVFLLNCLTPATGWGRTFRRANTKKSALEKQVMAEVQKAQQAANTPAAQFARADTAARKAHQEHFAQADADREANAIRGYVAEPYSTRIVQKIQPARIPVLPAKTFLRQVENGEIPFEELIEYADPLDPDLAKNDLMTMTSAAAVIGNNIDQLVLLDESQYDLAEIQKLIPQIQARLLYRMALLGSTAPSFAINPHKEPISQARTTLQQSFPDSIQKTMAIGTLRITLLKINQFYQSKGLPDPVDEYQKQKLAEQLAKSQPQRNIENRPRISSPSANSFIIQQRAAQGVAQHGNLANFQQQFINEIKQIVAQKPESGSLEYQHLQVLTEYAVAYALEYKPEAIKDIVKIFDEGVERNLRGTLKPGDFHRTYSPILNAIFGTIFENTRYSSMGEDKTKKVLDLLVTFSDPDRYSLPTRIFALEAASLFYRPFNAETLRKFSQQDSTSSSTVNLNQPDEKLRGLFAERIADIYCPLTSFAYQDYGLSAKEMQALADELAYSYDGFYDISSPQMHAPGQDPHRNAAQCTIIMQNEPNYAKRQSEKKVEGIEFLEEALFWMYGGELFNLVGTSLRLTRGAVAALPKAGKAFKSTGVFNAAKAMRFNKALQQGRVGLRLAKHEIQQGAKFTNWLSKVNREGYEVAFTVEKEAGIVEEVGASGAQTAKGFTTETKIITSTHQLQGQYSRWNPKRWLLNEQPSQKIIGMRVTQYKPNFEVTVAEAEFKESITGLRSMQDIEKAWAQLSFEGSSFPYTPKSWLQSILDRQQVAIERSLFDGVGKGLAKNVDTWVEINSSNSARITGTVSGQTAQGATYYWNLTRWGKPPTGYQANEWTRVFVSPSSHYSTLKAAAKYQAQLGVLDISSKLPGFFVSGADGLAGNLEKKVFNAFFKPMNWQNGITRTFLPDYVPTSMFWKFVQTNPELGVRLIPRLLWRNRFRATTMVLGLWKGADYTLYGPYNNWLQAQATQEAKNEIAKYGDTFSEEQAKLDELLLKDIGQDLSDKRAMNIYNKVAEAQKEEKDGTTLTAPIVFGLHTLGKTRVGEALGVGLPFVSEGIKADYAVQAQRTDLNRALLHRTHTQFKEGEVATAKWKQEVHEFNVKDEQAVLSLYSKGFAANGQLKQALHQMYQTYEKELFSAQTKEAQEKADANFIKQSKDIMYKAFIWDEVFKQAEKEIEGYKMWYYEFVTPEVENRFRQIYRTYAQARCEAWKSVKGQQAKLDKATQQWQQALAELEEEIRLKARAAIRSSFDDEGYGPNFDPDAAEK